MQVMRILEERLNTKVEMFAYPYGSQDSYNNKIIQYIKNAGYSCACALGSGNRKNGNIIFRTYKS